MKSSYEIQSLVEQGLTSMLTFRELSQHFGIYVNHPDELREDPTFKAMKDLYSRYHQNKSGAVTITCSMVIYEEFKFMETFDHEQFWVIYLNRVNKILAKKQYATGGVSGVIVPIQRIVRDALNINATAVILCHNHPSGVAKPSQPDMTITKQMKVALESVDLRLFDHIIIASDENYQGCVNDFGHVAVGSYYSFADEGML